MNGCGCRLLKAKGLGVLENYNAEVIAILEAIEAAIEQGWHML